MTNNRFFAGALLAATALTAATPAAAQRIDRIVAFGDSLADFGIGRTTIINDPAANPVLKATVTQIYPTGRFSGGTNYIDSLSDILGVPADSFAVGGALARTFPGGTNNTNCVPALGGQPSPAMCPLGFAYQVDQFVGVGVQSPLFPTTAAPFGANDLVTISIGINDSRFYQNTGGALSGAAADAALSVTGATTQIGRLVAAGAPTISFLAGDASRIPEVLANPSAQAIRAAYSNTFNPGIQASLAGFAANGVTIHYLDLNRVFDSILANPAAYGITKGSAASQYICPTPTPTAPGCLLDSSGYLFYFDGLHPTSTTLAIVARYVATQLAAPLTLQAPTDTALDTARQFGRTLTTRMDLGSPRDGDMPEGLGVYLVGDTVSRTIGASRTNDQFKVTTSGLSGGVEYGFGSGIVGAAINVSRPKANFANDMARDEVKSVQGGIYGGFGIAGAFVQGYGSLGRDRHELTRVGVVEGMDARTKGRHSAVGAKAGYLMPFGGLRVGPVIALDHARARVNGYTENGDDALTLNVGRESFSSLRGSLGAELRGDFGDAGSSVRPYASAVVEKDFTGDERTFDFAQTSAAGIVNHYRINDASKRAYGRLAAGLSAMIASNISVNASLSGTVAKKQGNDTSGHLGFRAAF